jgi:hypothetical protein
MIAESLVEIFVRLSTWITQHSRDIEWERRIAGSRSWPDRRSATTRRILDPRSSYCAPAAFAASITLATSDSGSPIVTKINGCTGSLSVFSSTTASLTETRDTRPSA